MKKIVINVITIGMFLGLAACGSSTTQGESQTAASTAAQTEASTEDTPTNIEVTDSNGKVTVPYQPEKVVVFDNSALDTIKIILVF